MTTTARPASLKPTPAENQEPVFLIGPDYKLTARDVVLALGSYLASFGDNIGPKGVSPLDAIHSEIAYGFGVDGIRDWQRDRTPEDIAVIRARAEHIACDFFGHHFPAIIW
jgi:hypothetical protein